MYSNNQEYEMIRLSDSLSTVPTETKMVVRLGRALLPGEFRIKLFLLRINDAQVRMSCDLSLYNLMLYFIVYDANPGVHSSQRYVSGRLQSSAHSGGIQTRHRPKADG